MVNLIIMSIPVVGYYTDFHFWVLLFLAVAVCRYRFNQDKTIFVTSIIGTLVLSNPKFIFFAGITVKTFLLFQFFIGIWSLFYNIKKRIWKWDVVFFIMEPALMIIFVYYFITGFPVTTILNRLYYWISIYITIQVILIIAKVFIAYKISYKAENFWKRLKLLISYLPHIEPSFGLGDFATSGGAMYCSLPTTLSIMIDEVEFTNDIVYAEMKGNVDEIKIIKKRREDVLKKTKFLKNILKMFKQD